MPAWGQEIPEGLCICTAQALLAHLSPVLTGQAVLGAGGKPSPRLETVSDLPSPLAW